MRSSSERSNAGTLRPSSSSTTTGRAVSDQAARERLKIPLFHDIVGRQARLATHARSARDAFLITLNELGTLDFNRMAELLGSTTAPRTCITSSPSMG